MGSRVKLPELRALVVMLKSSVGSVCVLLMLVGEGSCQYYRGVYPAHTAPLHLLSYQVPGSFGSYQSNFVRHQLPFRNSKVSPLLSNFLTRIGPNAPGYGSGVIVV